MTQLCLTTRPSVVATVATCFAETSESISKNGILRSTNKQVLVPLFGKQVVATPQSLRTVPQNQARRVIMLVLTSRTICRLAVYCLRCHCSALMGVGGPVVVVRTAYRYLGSQCRLFTAFILALPSN